jgi:hypothetical protein
MKMSEMPATISPVVLVVAPPGYYRESLVALLGTVRHSQRVFVAGDLHQAGLLIGPHEPDLVLLATPPSRPATAALKPMVERMRRTWPQARIVLLTDTSEDQPAGPLADARLRTNASAGDLVGLFGEAFPNPRPQLPITQVN